jgi:hypothetical protein
MKYKVLIVYILLFANIAKASSKQTTIVDDNVTTSYNTPVLIEYVNDKKIVHF